MLMNQQSEPQVAIIGTGITGLSVAARLEQAGIPFIMFEKEHRVGGQIRTLREKGYTFEVGPNTGAMSTPEVAELFEYASPLAVLETAQKEAAYRWIWKGKRFHTIPSGPVGGLLTPLFTLKDKFRVLLEPFRKKGTDPYESVGDLAARRLGQSFVDYAVDPFIGGIYAGDPFRLTTQFALPKLYQLEQEYGSFIKGAIKKAKQPKSDRDRKATKEVFSAEGGLENLVSALVTKISRMGTILTGVEKITTSYVSPNCWDITYETGGVASAVRVSHVVSTVRADLLEEVLPKEIASSLLPISSLEYAPITEIAVGFDHLPSVRRNAFGGLVPSREKRKILGILFPSSCFRGRVPYDDSALFTIFMEGIRNADEFRGLSEDEIVKIGLGELYDMMKIPKEVEPSLIHVSRYEKAIPQYMTSSEQRLERMRELESTYAGLHLAGGLSEGIGLAHRITQGTNLGKAIAESFLKNRMI